MEAIKNNERRFFAFAAGNPLAEERDTVLRIRPILPDTQAFQKFTCEQRVSEYLARHGLTLAAGPLFVVPGRERAIAAEVDVAEDVHDCCSCMHQARSKFAMRLGEIDAREVQRYIVAPSECEPMALNHAEGVDLGVTLGPREQRQFILSAPELYEHKAHGVRIDHYALHCGHEHYIGGFNVLFVPERVKARELAERP